LLKTTKTNYQEVMVLLN